MIDMARVERLKLWDIQDYLKTPEDVAHYLEAVFEDGDPELIAAALGDVARSGGMADLAHKAGVSREALDAALGDSSSPEATRELTTLIGVFKTLGLRLSCRVAAG